MKKTFIIAVATFLLGFGLNNVVVSETLHDYNVAVVDINKIVAKSGQVQALKKEQIKKTEELQKWLKKVQADIAKQATEADKQKLAQKYNADFAKKQETIEIDYAKNLSAIEKSISATIQKEAKAQNFDLVLAKGVVLYGGTDITESISKVVK